MALAPLDFLALFSAMAGAPSPEEAGEYRVSVIGANVLLEPATAGDDVDMFEGCIGATGPQTVIDSLRSLPERGVVRLRYEEVPYPEFRPLITIGDTPLDYAADVRGRRVTRWCATRRFFWITALDTPLQE